MQRLLAVMAVGGIVGLGLGIFIGWGCCPVEYVNGSLSQLAPQYQAEYAVMVAQAYRRDGDANLALERLSHLGMSNIPEYVQQLTEEHISLGRSVDDIHNLVALATGLGRRTAIMGPFALTPTPMPTLIAPGN